MAIYLNFDLHISNISFHKQILTSSSIMHLSKQISATDEASKDQEKQL